VTTRCGIVALAGRPNAGKSTLLNALVGEPLSIVSPKPQTTREPVRGLISDDASQIILVDPAGLLDPAYQLQRAMLHAALATIADADLVLYLHPLPDGPAPALASLLPERTRAPKRQLAVYTKADLRPGRVPPLAVPDGAEAALAVSAETGQGIAELLAAVRERLPSGPFLYDPDDLGTQPLRFFAAEYVREAAFAELEQELPYSVAVAVDEFRESETPVYIRATLAVERDSQKPIVLGKGGRTIKAIGTAARLRLEALLGRRVRLELWVTVWPKWRRDPAALARLGLPLTPEKDA
jgi:GTP-binding protein Era